MLELVLTLDKDALLLMVKLLIEAFKLSRPSPGEMAAISGLRSSTTLVLVRQVGDGIWQGWAGGSALDEATVVRRPF